MYVDEYNTHTPVASWVIAKFCEHNGDMPQHIDKSVSYDTYIYRWHFTQ